MAVSQEDHNYPIDDVRSTVRQYYQQQIEVISVVPCRYTPDHVTEVMSSSNSLWSVANLLGFSPYPIGPILSRQRFQSSMNEVA